MRILLVLIASMICANFAYSQTEVYDTYMSMDQEQFNFLECLVDDTPTKRRKLIDYKPNNKVLFLEHSCNNSPVDIAFLGNDNELVGLIYEDMVTLEQVLVVMDYNFIEKPNVSLPTYSTPSNSSQIDSNLLWGFDNEGNLTKYFKQGNKKKVVATWTFEGNHFARH